MTANARRLWSPLFAFTAIAMAVLGIGIPPALSAIKAHFAKEPIDLRRTLHEFDPDRVPTFVTTDAWAPPSVDPRSLGTEEFYTEVFRPREDRDGSYALLLTFYNDPEDSIPHTPEVCYRQIGSVVDRMTRTKVKMADLGEVDVRVLDISQGPHHLLIVYSIVHNGQAFYEREQVRLAMGIPGDKFTYFTKVEVATEVRRNQTREEALEKACRLLSESFEILREDYLPLDADLR